VKTRRLRSWPGTLIGSVEPPVVGGSHAAFIDNSPVDDHPMMIVRLKDGVS
jgi:hypothetical protein